MKSIFSHLLYFSSYIQKQLPLLSCGLLLLCTFHIPNTFASQNINHTPEACQSFGDTIQQNKTSQTPTGSYKDRDDVKAFAAQVAQCYHLDHQWILNTLTQAQYQASSVKFIMPQPAGKRNWNKFVNNFVQPERINQGVKFWQENTQWLEQAEKDFNIPPKIILGILGVETIYGKITGNFRIMDVLSTLSFDFPSGRSDRTDFFASELAAFLKYAAEENIDPFSIRGSYAGAIGMPQFMPTSIENYAIDYDGDGHIDLANSIPDIIGSVANYLTAHHWQAGLPASLYLDASQATDQQINLLKSSDITPTFSTTELHHHGVQILHTPPSKQPSFEDVKFAFIVLENGDDSPPTYVLGTQNFYVITRYNRSSFYAMSVIELANAIEQAYKKANR